MSFFLIVSLILPVTSSMQVDRNVPSYGTISYLNALTELRIEGNVIRNSAGPIFLLGANIRSQANNPQTDGRYDGWYTYRQEDAANIKSYGFNTVRLLMYWECLEISNSSAQFLLNDTYIEQIKETVNAYNKNGLYVILNLHEHGAVNTLGNFVPTNGNDADFADAFYSDRSNTSALVHLEQLWLALSNVFANFSGIAGYDLLNEPHHSKGSLTNQEVADYWFDMADNMISILRTNGDNHIVFVDFAPWASSAIFMSRKLNDSNVAYSPHFYEGINTADFSVTDNDYDWLAGQFNTTVNATMNEFSVPFVMEEQGFEGCQLNANQTVWLENVLTISKTNPLMQGWLYWCYIAYNGVPQGGGWQDILVENMG